MVGKVPITMMFAEIAEVMDISLVQDAMDVVRLNVFIITNYYYYFYYYIEFKYFKKKNPLNIK